MRGLLTIVIPLALPTLLFLLYVRWAQRRAGAAEPIVIPWWWLAAAGLALVAITLVGYGLFIESQGRGTYHPARTIDGKIQPGYFDKAPQ